MYCCSCCCCCVAGFCCCIGVVSVSVFPSLLCSCLCVYVYICVFCGWGREANVCVHACMYVCCFVFFCILSIYQELLFWHYRSQSFAFQHAHIYTHEHYVTASGVPNHTSRAWDNNRVIFSPQPIVLACRKRATTAIDDDRGQHSPIVRNRLTTKTDEGTSFGWLHARHIPLLQPV